VSTGELDRRAAERDAADRRYNDALTAVDAALPSSPALPPPTPPEETFDASLGERAAILGSGPEMPAGWRGRLAAFVWRLVGPVFERQQACNVALAAQLQRLAAAERESAARAADVHARMQQHLEAFFTFDARLVQYLQQVTPFVDTKVRLVEASLDELRMAASAAMRSAVAAKRELERLGASSREQGAAMGPPAAPAGASAPQGGGAAYVGFEDVFRGSSEDIRARQRDYADAFTGATDVLDLGCGRGEFLELLRERGVPAHGIEANAEMAGVCRARGLDVREGDALAHLDTLPDDSLGGVVALQVVEHLQPEYLVRLVETAHAKLRPGGRLVLETINAACWVAFFESYIRDITHVRPLHPETLKFLVVAAGFEGVDIHYRSPVAPAGRLQAVASDDLPPALAPLAAAFNANVERLNGRLFTYLDYAVIGSKAH
jgi:SAM-dependent methyltransferase